MVQLAVAAALTALATASCGEATAARPSATVRDAVIDGIAAGTLMLPNAPASVKFAVIGDSGRGNTAQREVADQMARYHDQFKFPFTIMLGDNLYEGEATPEDYRVKFEEPYKALLDRGVRFYAALGNHDDPRQVHYAQFNMEGHRYYSFAPPGNILARVTTTVEFFALDSTYMDRQQLSWLNRRLGASAADWKICFLHHPVYTSGRYRMASLVQRASLESLFVTNDVNVVFSGHEHIYQRSTLQNGIQYFVSGGAGSLRPGDGVPTAFIARTYSGDYHFMLVEIERDTLHFQAISRTGRTIDAGTLSRAGSRPPASPITALGTAGRR
jgi:predicted phosphodiesterase